MPKTMMRTRERTSTGEDMENDEEQREIKEETTPSTARSHA